jgi:hypothetical protein
MSGVDAHLVAIAAPTRVEIAPEIVDQGWRRPESPQLDATPRL